MSNPYQGQGFVTPGPSPKSGPSCWLVGGLTCLGIVVLAVALLALGVFSFLGSKTGRDFKKMYGKVLNTSSQLPDCEAKMLSIRGAVIRYHERTGSYPKNLAVLTPVYLPDPHVMHCGLDTNPDPSHVTFVYTRPAGGALSTAPLISVTMNNDFQMAGQTTTLSNKISVTLGGSVTSVEVQNGKVIGNYQTTPP